MGRADIKEFKEIANFGTPEDVHLFLFTHRIMLIFKVIYYSQ